MNYDLYIKNAVILNADYEIEENQCIGILEGTIAYVGEAKEEVQAAEVIDAGGFLWMPGLVDGHMHTGQQLLRGRVLDELPMIWTRIMLPFESGLTKERMDVSAKLAALEMMKSGTTGFVDAGSYHMEQAAQVYVKSGLRGALSYSTMDMGQLPESIRDTTDSAITKTNALYDAYHGEGNLQIYYSLRSLISCSETLMERAYEEASSRSTMLQAHMNEYPGEINFFLERHQMRPLEFLDRLHVLDERFISAHSLLLSEHEMDILRDRHVKVVHCPFSNCGKAAPKTPALQKRGISVALGTDGTAHGGMSLFNEMKIFRSVMNVCQGAAESNPRIMPAKTILKMVLEGGAAVSHMEGRGGAIKPGYAADLISIDITQPHLYPTNNLVNTIVESVNAGDVKDMVVNGKLIMRNRQVLTLDEEKILAEAKEIMKKMK